MAIFTRMSLASSVLAAFASFTQTASAQDALTAPQPLTQPQPPQPTNAGGVPVAGWAVVRYSVLKDGTVDDARVLRTVPENIVTAPTVETVETWTFRPGMEGNEAIDWHNTESVVIYAMPAPPAAPNFQAEYDAIAALLEPPTGLEGAALEAAIEMNLEAAIEMNRALLEETATQLPQLGRALAQRAIIAIGMQDVPTAYESIRTVTDPRVSALSAEDLLVGLQVRMQVAADGVGRIYDALDAHGRLVAGLGEEEASALAPLGAALRDRVENEETLEVVGYIREEPWRISADRRIFTIVDVMGSLDRVDVECDRRKATLEFQPEVEWKLPASWGNCELLVHGEPGTTFRFFHFLEAAE